MIGAIWGKSNSDCPEKSFNRPAPGGHASKVKGGLQEYRPVARRRGREEASRQTLRFQEKVLRTFSVVLRGIHTLASIALRQPDRAIGRAQVRMVENIGCEGHQSQVVLAWSRGIQPHR